MKMSNDIKWSKFPLVGIFDLKPTKSSIDKKNLTGFSGITPYITRSGSDNGIGDFVGNQPDYVKDKGNAITIGLDTQTVFYQPTGFYTGQNIQVLRNSHLNKYIALYMIPLIKKQLAKFNWGGNGATLSRLKNLYLYLPSINSETPDYEYMDKYMRQIEKEYLHKYYDYLEFTNRLNQSLQQRKDLTWKQFVLDEECTILPGVRLIASDTIPGKTPYIGASETNNGITRFVSNRNDSLDKNVLGVNYNGSVGFAFYHPYESLFSDDVKRIHWKDVEGCKYSYLFLASSIHLQKTKFQYGYKMNGERMKKLCVMLPESSAKPDHPGMINIMQSIEYKLLNRYILYRFSQLKNENV